MTRILLIRHAQAAPAGDLYLPGPDLPLLPVGVRQASRLAARLEAFGPCAVSTSDAVRARQTAEIAAAARAIPLRATPALREIDVGEWAGRTYEEIVAADPAVAAWFADPEAMAPPGGERAEHAAARVLRLLLSLAEDDIACVAVVGHAGSLRLAVARALGMPLASYWRLRLDYAALSVLDWTTNGPLLERWNDTTHLEGITP